MAASAVGSSVERSGSKPLQPYQSQLIALLHIPANALTQGKNLSVKTMWIKYVECSKALQTAKTLATTTSWPRQIHFTEELIISLFISKTVWYRSYRPIFTAVQGRASQMRDWLEKETTMEQENIRLWGFHANEYGEADLKEWLEQKGFLGNRAAEEAAAAQAREEADRLERLQQAIQDRQEREREEAERNRLAGQARRKRKNTGQRR